MFLKKNRWMIGLLFVCIFMQTMICSAKTGDVVSVNEIQCDTVPTNEVFCDTVSGNEEFDKILSGNEVLGKTVSENEVENNRTDADKTVDGTNAETKKISDTAWMKEPSVSLFSLVEAEVWEYAYKGAVQTFVAPADAIYKLEVWGGQGAGVNNTIEPGGKGGYSIGYRKVKKGETIYVVVGQDGNRKQGGYNGGGHGGCYGDPGDSGYGGGGCTHMALTNRGELRNYNAYRSEVLIVAGGGGGQGGYIDHYVEGGSGGGLTGGCVSESIGGGSQTSPGTNSSTKYGAGFGYGGDGIDGNYNYGGGGGGWYGGRVACGSGGGSGYIGGVPAFSFSGDIYQPSTQNGVRSGNGFARITMMKKLIAASLWENEIEILEKKTVSMKADIIGAVSYQWQLQKKQGDIPSDEGWQTLDVDGTNIREKVSLESGAGTIELLLPAEMEYSDYWFRIWVQGEEENLASSACHLHVIPLKMERLEIFGEVPDMEIGDVLKIDTILVKVIYNNEDIQQEITAENGLSELLYFVKDGLLTKEYLLEEVSDCHTIDVQLLHDDKPEDASFCISVFDHTEPVIHDVQIKKLDYTSQEEKEVFQLEISAEDNSNGVLNYWYERKSDRYISEKSTTPLIEAWLEKNDTIVIYTQDESGNISFVEKQIFYVDKTAPDILNVYLEPSTKWYEGSVWINVETTDDLSGLHEMAYSFDCGNTWQSSNKLELKDSLVLEIVVRDLVGNISSVYCLSVRKHIKTASSHIENTDRIEKGNEESSIFVVGEFPYVTKREREEQRKLLDIYNQLPTQKKDSAKTLGKSDVESKNSENFAENNSFEELTKSEDTKGRNDETKLEEKEEIQIPLSEAAPKKSRHGQAAKAVATTVTTGSMSFMLFALFRKADIYKVNELHQEEYVASKIIWKKKKRYYLFWRTKTEPIEDKGTYCIRISKGFCKRKRNAFLEIIIQKKVYATVHIKEKMYLEL